MRHMFRTALILAAAMVLGGCVGYGYPGAYGSGNGYGNQQPYPYPGGANGQVFRCESQDNRMQRCNADTRYGVRINRQLSGSACVEGRSWGYDRTGVWVSNGCRAEFVTGGGYGGGTYPGGATGQVFRCESQDNRMQRCNADTRYGVRINRQLSGSACVEGRSWGYDNTGVWVSNGCRAEFVTGGGYGGGTYPGGGYGQGQTLRCESQDNRMHRCNAVVQRTVQLQRRLSDSPCVQGSSWGWDRNGVWVDRGCRADFLVY